MARSTALPRGSPAQSAQHPRNRSDAFLPMNMQIGKT
jgi:hypothetical protein